MSDDSEAGEDVESDNNGSFAQNDVVIRRSCCRYGSGCTHIFDPSHRDRFWHPSAPKLNNEQLKSQFICNECGYATSHLKVLQVHLQRKTAWSNTSLIGCRINCLVDLKEWHEGFVLQFHKSGKHYVEFRQVNEKRWLIMKKIAFYILERPASEGKEESEFKEDETEGLAPEEDNWVFCEDISLDYTFAQSVLFKIYGNSIQETGHLTKGHTCLSDADRLNAQYVKGSLLYGELLPRGANKAFGPDRLNTSSASVLFDLGMGTGKILIQAFLQFKNLRYIFGIELSAGRYKLAEEALLRMVRLLGEDNYHVQINPGRFIIVTEVVRVSEEGDGGNAAGDNAGDNGHGKSSSGKEEKSEDGDFVNGGDRRDPPEEVYMERVLHLQCGNMFDVKNINSADVVMMETDIPTDQHGRLQGLLSQMKPDAKVLTYLDLRRIWQNSNSLFRQLEVNRHQADRYPTSWSVQRGHHFYLWSKVSVLIEQPSGSNKNNSNSWLPQLHHPPSTTTPVKSHHHNSNSNSAAGGPSESPIAFNPTTPYTTSPHRVHSNKQNNTTNKNNSTEIDTQQTGCLPWQWWFTLTGRSQRSAHAKIVKKVVSVAEYEQNQQQSNVPGNQHSVSPAYIPNTSTIEQNTNNSVTGTIHTTNGMHGTSPVLQIEALDVPSRQTRSAQSSNDANNTTNTINTGGHAFSLSPRSGRVSPQLSPTFPINTESTNNTSNIAHTLSARHTTHTPSPVYQQDNQLPLLSVDELQFGSHRNSSGSKRSSKHRNKEASAGADSVKSKSPREPRESKKKNKAARASVSSANADIIINNNSPRGRMANKSNPVTPRGTALPSTSLLSSPEEVNVAISTSLHLANPSSLAAVSSTNTNTNTNNEMAPYSPVTSLSQRDASSVYLQHSAAMGAIDGMNSSFHSPQHGSTLPYTPVSSENLALVNGSSTKGSTKSRAHKSKDSPSLSPRTPPAVSLEANVWHDTHPHGTNNAVHFVSQDLVSTETITGQASAGARVLVQQMNAYGPPLSETDTGATGRSGKSKKNESGKSSRNSNVADLTAAGKPRSYRIHNTIPVRAHSPGDLPNNNTASGANSTTGFVTTAAPLPVRAEVNRSQRNVHKPTNGCMVM